MRGMGSVYYSSGAHGASVQAGCIAFVTLVAGG